MPRHEGCECLELCSMGPTCPGGMLAGLPGSGCWRTEEPCQSCPFVACPDCAYQPADRDAPDRAGWGEGEA